MIRISLLAGFALSLLTMGCAPPETIVQHKVHKSKSGLEALRKPPQEAKPSTSPQFSEKTELRMIVAWFDRDDATWFFKVSGPQERVTLHANKILAAFKTIKFEKGSFAWDAPDSWKEGPPKNRFGHSSFLVDGEKPIVEVAITKMAPNQPELSNVNRWLGQLNRTPIKQDKVESVLHLVKGDPGYFLFDEQGTGTGKMSPPFAKGPFANAPFANAPFANGGMSGGSSAPQLVPFTYDAPKGWVAGRTNSIVKVRVVKDTQSPPTQITVTEMPAANNPWVPNVERWADQAGLKLTNSEIEAQTDNIKVGGIDSKKVTLIKDDAEFGLVGVRTQHKDNAWFFKLSGKPKQVRANLAAFEAFISSVKLK